ncbi:unnamed protein product [Nippostrongylus brasiliensis]|uniref:Leishmanolysin-like peptidase n=1 Tax=Nippostrongylus brasiliensis TaxID=27835 RepID=A0A0N4YQT6_NIPBR|nr:unnamed protein product [Nippostrongylus brasiliensis]
MRRVALADAGGERWPLSGYVNICPYQFNRMKSNEMSQWLATVKHELTHAFVFSQSHFARFPGAGNVTQKKPIPIVPGVVEKFTRKGWRVSSGTIDRDVYMIVTPKVRAEVRKYFNCPDLEGAELEDQLGPGTQGVHWEKRVLENEAMSGVATQVYAMSRITLALFEDSGWYEADYSKAENMTWGKGLGCKFAKESCLSWMTGGSGHYPFCVQQGHMTCNANRKSKVLCNFIEYKQLPTNYDYNVKGLYYNRKGKKLHGGGNEEAADFCPYYRVFGEMVKEDKDTRCTYSGNLYYNNYSMETMCKDGRLHVKVQDSKFYPCFYAGQYIYIEKYVFKVGFSETKIVCPDCREICGECAPEIHMGIDVDTGTTDTVTATEGMVLVATAVLVQVDSAV